MAFDYIDQLMNYSWSVMLVWVDIDSRARIIQAIGTCSRTLSKGWVSDMQCRTDVRMVTPTGNFYYSYVPYYTMRCADRSDRLIGHIYWSWSMLLIDLLIWAHSDRTMWAHTSSDTLKRVVPRWILHNRTVEVGCTNGCTDSLIVSGPWEPVWDKVGSEQGTITSLLRFLFTSEASKNLIEKRSSQLQNVSPCWINPPPKKTSCGTIC